MQWKASLLAAVFTALRLSGGVGGAVVNVDLNIQNAQLAPNGVSRS